MLFKGRHTQQGYRIYSGIQIHGVKLLERFAPLPIAAMMIAKPVRPVRAKFVLVVSDLKPVLRAGDMGAGLVSKLTRPGSLGVSVLMAGIRLGLQIRKSHDGHVNANRGISLCAFF